MTRYNLPSGSYPEKSDAGYLEGCILRVTALHVTRHILPSGRFLGNSDTNLHPKIKEAYKANTQYG